MLTRVNSFLRSEAATLALVVVAIAAQGPHAAEVFLRLAPHGGWLGILHATLYAIALELATLVFVVRGRQRLAWLFAFVSVAVNFVYYAGNDLQPAQWFGGALVSLALPVSIAFYSHEVADAATEAQHGLWDATNAVATPEPAGMVDCAPNVEQTFVALPMTSDVPAQGDDVTAAQQVAQTTQAQRKPAQAQRKAQTDASARKPALTPAQRRAQLAQQGITDADRAAALFRVSLRTAQADIAAVRSGVVQVNGNGAK